MSLHKNIFNGLSIRYKLLVGYAGIFVFIVVLGSTATYFFVKKLIEANIENKLTDSTNNVLNMVRTAAHSSIRNRLRAVAATNLNVVEHFYSEFKNGKLTQAEAKASAQAVMKRQVIGTTGYIYCIDSKGVMLMHPRLSMLGRNISEYQFVQEQLRRHEGYLEYDWQNPGEVSPRAKALYMVYFKPWDWIISVSSYREEFTELISVDDFRSSVLSLKFAESGYATIVDERGNIIIHPRLSGNYYDAEDADGFKFIQHICRSKSGKINYTWRSPGEKDFREKLAYFNYLPEYGWIVVSTSYYDEILAPLTAARGIFITVALLSLLLLVPMSIGISRAITRCIEDLKEGFAQGAGGDLSVRMTPQCRDEIGTLALYFNDFMARLESEHYKREQAEKDRFQMADKLRQSQKMEAVGQLAGGVAHDFNNILTAVLGSAELLRAQTKGTHDALIESIIQAASRAADLTRNLLDFSRKGMMQTVSVDIHEMLKEVSQLLSHSIDKRIDVTCRLESEAPVIIGDPSKLQNSFLNLGVNARDAMPNGGRMEFSTSDVFIEQETLMRSGILKPGRYIKISVSDTGTGIAPDNTQRIFEPFFTTKEQGKGTGLGLASVYGCVAVHNGEIDMETNFGSGTRFDIYLPCPQYAREPRDSVGNLGIVRGEGRVMIVDDENIVLTYVTGVLDELGYTASAFDDPEEAVRYFKEHHETIHLVILDLIMPKMGGRETLHALLEIDSDIPVLIVSGYSPSQGVDILKEGARHYLRKPFQLEELSQLIAAHKRA